ncbi:MAG: hypothetical protein IPM48_12465 [Saprospiraceae bacterium]|nr:hypothetical protein [Saprospiraceae bacterium]
MSTIYFSYVKTEQKNSIKGTVYAIIAHLLLLLIIFFFKFEIIPPEDPDSPPYLSLVSFVPLEKMKQYENAGGSKGAEGLETKEGGSEGESKPSPTPEPVEVADKKVETTPVEKIPTPSGPKTVVTTTEPDIVTLPTPPKVTITTTPTESTGTSSTTTTPTKTTTHSSSGDEDTPGTGGTGTGSGAGTGSGGSSSGSGTGAGGGTGTGGGGGSGGGEGSGTGSGTGDGVGVNFDELGELRRRRESCSIDARTLAGPVLQSAVFNICIDRQGYITYTSFNSKKSLTRDIKFVRAAMAQIKSCKYVANPSAARKECGMVTVKIAGMEKRLN